MGIQFANGRQMVSAVRLNAEQQARAVKSAAGISKRGRRYLRALLDSGVARGIRTAKDKDDRLSQWVTPSGSA